VGLGTVCRGRQDPKRKADLDDYFSEGGGATVAWGSLAFSSGRRPGPSTPGRCGLSCICRRATWSHGAAACGQNQISTNHKCKDAIWDLVSGVSALETHLGRRDYCLLRGQVRASESLTWTKHERVAAPTHSSWYGLRGGHLSSHSRWHGLQTRRYSKKHHQSFLLPPPLPPLQPPNHKPKNWQISEMQGFHWEPGFLRLDRAS
jgi:hypothetical protein